MELFVESLANMFDALVGTYFIMRLNKGSFKECRLFIPTVLICFLISTVFLYVSAFSILNTILWFIVLYIFSFSVKSRTTASAIVGPLIFELTIAIVGTTTALAISHIAGIDMVAIGSGLSVARIALLLISKLIVASILFPIIHFYTPGRYLKPIDFVIYLLSPIVTIFVLAVFIVVTLNVELERYYPAFMASSLCLVTTNIVSLLMFARHTKNEEEKHEMEILLKLKETELQRHMDTMKIHESIRILRHDMKEQLFFAKRMVEAGKTNAAHEHIDKLEEIIEGTNTYINTGNSIIDSILYSKMTLNPDIRFIVSGSVGDLSRIGDVELVSLFTNMLDNAIEATKDQNKKIIELTFSLVGGFQSISCKNPTRVSHSCTEADLQTTKKDKALHGYGIKSMRKTVESLDGMIEFYIEEGCFICHVALPEIVSD